MNSVLVPMVSRLLSHADIGMTLRYAHFGDRDIEKTAERAAQAIPGSWHCGPPPDRGLMKGRGTPARGIAREVEDGCDLGHGVLVDAVPATALAAGRVRRRP